MHAKQTPHWLSPRLAKWPFTRQFSVPCKFLDSSLTNSLEMTVAGVFRGQAIEEVGPGTGEPLLCLLSVLVSFPVTVIKIL